MKKMREKTDSQIMDTVSWSETKYTDYKTYVMP